MPLRTMGSMRYQPPSHAELENFNRITKLLFFVLLSAIPMYFFIQEVVAGQYEVSSAVAAEGEGLRQGLVEMLLWIIALGTAAVVVSLRFLLMPWLQRSPRLDIPARLNRLRAFYILCFALSESVALYGFVLRLLGGTRDATLVFYATAVFLFILCYPRLPESLSHRVT